MRAALADDALLGSILPGESWSTWRTFLIALTGEALDADERAIFTKFTGRTEPPPARVEEAAFVVGRRGGKDRAASVLATYIAGLCKHPALARGERGVVILIAADQRQAAITLSYIEACFEASPVLARLIASRTADTLSLASGIDVEVRSASFRRLRGTTALAVIASEVAFWRDEFVGQPGRGNPECRKAGAGDLGRAVGHHQFALRQTRRALGNPSPALWACRRSADPCRSRRIPRFQSDAAAERR
jgi:hypothetical protein